VARKTKRTLSLVVTVFIVAVMGIVYAWSGRRGETVNPEETPPPASEAITLFDRTQAEVTRIYVRHGDEEAKLFLPRGAAQGDSFEWYLADHPDWVLDDWGVQNLLRSAFVLTAQERILEDTYGTDLAEFGFDPPQATLTAHDTDGYITSVYLGNETPDRQHFFAMVSGDPAMYLLSRFLAPRMLITLDDIICRAFPPLHADSLDYMRLAQRGRDAFEITRTDDPEILETIPDRGFAPLVVLQPAALAERTVDTFNLSRMVLEEFFAEFRLGSVAALMPDDLAPFGLDDPYIDFLVESADGLIHLRFGDIFVREADGVGVPHIYVMYNDRPHVFMAELVTVNPITDVNVMHFITRFIALINILDVERIGIVHTQIPERNLEMIINHDFSEGNNDIFPTVNGVEISAAPFRVLYRTLISIGADAPLDPQPPQGTPKFTVTFYLHDGTQTEIDFFDFDGNFYTFSVDGEYVWAVTNRRGVEAFFAEAARLLASPE